MADDPQTPEQPDANETPEAAVPPEAVVEEAIVEEAIEEAIVEEAVEEAVVEEAIVEAVVEEAVVEAEAQTPRAKPAIPGADLEVDIVPEGADPLARAGGEAVEAEYGEPVAEPEAEHEDSEAVEEPEAAPQAVIDLAAGARYRATGKRKTAVARVILKPGTGAYLVNGKDLNTYFPRDVLQRTIRQPLETVGFEDRMDVIASLHGGGVSSQAGALRHGVSRALLEADPNLRGELKRRGFLTRDARVKERKKAGLKKARKRPQFSKR